MGLRVASKRPENCDNSVPDGYVERVTNAFPNAIRTILKQAAIGRYELGLMTADELEAFIADKDLGDA
jgi:hypothetical protein